VKLEEPESSRVTFRRVSARARKVDFSGDGESRGGGVTWDRRSAVRGSTSGATRESLAMAITGGVGHSGGKEKRQTPDENSPLVEERSTERSAGEPIMEWGERGRVEEIILYVKRGKGG